MNKAENKILWFVSTLEDVRFVKEFSSFYAGHIEVVHLNFLTRFVMLTSRLKSHIIWPKRK